MATSINEVPIAQGLARRAPIRWCLNVTSDDLTTAAIIKTAEPGKKHWIERLIVTMADKKAFSILDGDDVLIGPVGGIEGIPWPYDFHRSIHGSENTNLKMQTSELTGIHALIEGYTDSYPEFAYSPTPADGATGVLIGTGLTWYVAPHVTSCDVYLDNAFQGNQVETTFTPTLYPHTTYTWRINVKDNGDTIAGDTWSFTTA
jgi:hypothetical protein